MNDRANESDHRRPSSNRLRHRPAQANPLRAQRAQVYFSVASVAAATAWSVEQARERLEYHGALVRHGTRYFTTRGLLRRAYPNTHSELYERLLDPRAHAGEPLYFDTADVAEKMGWTVKRTREWLQRERAVEFIYGRYFTTRGLLRRAFPQTWAEVAARMTG